MASYVDPSLALETVALLSSVEMTTDWEERLMALEDFIPSEQPPKLMVTIRDLFLIRSGLESLLRIYTRHEHLNREIKELLRRLPEVGFEYELAA